QTTARADAISEIASAVIRIDAVEQTQATNRTTLIQAMCDSLDTLARRIDAWEARKAEADARRAEEARRDEARQADEASERELQEALSSLGTFTPGGELHSLPAKPEADEASSLLPAEIENPLSSTQPEPVPSGRVQPQPIAVSLNED